jgi:predicted thioesterase
VSAVVADADTAISAGSGDVPVLATPRLLALAEAAAVAAIAPHLAPGMTSVGTSASLEHRRASPVGAEVVVEAELTEVDGRRLMFSFIARESGQDGDEDLVVGAGTVERVLVDRAAFLGRAAGHRR